jgi:hypothetical protein
MNKSKKTESCRKLFKEMEILPFSSQYILSLSMYVVNNKHLFTNNLEVHSHNTRSANNLHVPAANLTKYKKGAHYMRSKIFNHLPNHIKGLVNGKTVFKKTLQKFLFDDVFKSIDGFLNFNVNNSNNFKNCTS